MYSIVIKAFWQMTFFCYKTGAIKNDQLSAICGIIQFGIFGKWDYI